MGFKDKLEDLYYGVVDKASDVVWNAKYYGGEAKKKTNDFIHRDEIKENKDRKEEASRVYRQFGRIIKAITGMNDIEFIRNSDPKSSYYQVVETFTDAYNLVKYFNEFDDVEKRNMIDNVSMGVKKNEKMKEFNNGERFFIYFYNRLKEYREYKKKDLPLDIDERKYCTLNSDERERYKEKLEKILEYEEKKKQCLMYGIEIISRDQYMAMDANDYKIDLDVAISQKRREEVETMLKKERDDRNKSIRNLESIQKEHHKKIVELTQPSPEELERNRKLLKEIVDKKNGNKDKTSGGNSFIYDPLKQEVENIKNSQGVTEGQVRSERRK